MTWGPQGQGGRGGQRSAFGLEVLELLAAEQPSRDVDDPVAAIARSAPKQVERRHRVHALQTHRHADRALDVDAAVERVLQLLDDLALLARLNGGGEEAPDEIA